MTTFKTSFRKILGGLALIAASTAAQAAPIEFSTTQSGLNISGGTTFSLQTGYNPATDTLGSLQLTLNFANGHNNASNNAWADKPFDVTFGDITLNGSTAASVTLNTTAFNVDTSQYISSQGIFSFTVADLHTHARLTGYTLNISGVSNPQQEQPPIIAPMPTVPVPAPSTLALLSLGILGAGLMGRRRNAAIA